MIEGRDLTKIEIDGIEAKASEVKKDIFGVLDILGKFPDANIYVIMSHDSFSSRWAVKRAYFDKDEFDKEMKKNNNQNYSALTGVVEDLYEKRLPGIDFPQALMIAGFLGGYFKNSEKVEA